MKHPFLQLLAALTISTASFATNPFVTDQFTADPTARVFEGKVYVYPSHDIREPPDYKGRPNWFVMEDYHVYSSENLNDWTDHGVILTRADVAWADQSAYAMWAPDCVFKDGKYYFYFPAMAQAKDNNGGGMRIGVAISDKPYGPFKPEATYIKGVQGIDPGIFIDKDGSAYMSWGFKDNLFIAKLKPNMLEIEGEPQAIDNLPKKGLQEGPLRTRTRRTTSSVSSTRPARRRWVRSRGPACSSMSPRAAAGPFTSPWSSSKGSGTCSITIAISRRISTSAVRSARTSCSSTRTAASRR
jgi:hypothetical protein